MELEKNVIDGLGSVYLGDLTTLQKIDTSVTTPADINLLRSFSLAYLENPETVTAENFIEILGRLLRTIREKLESLAITHVLGHELAENPEKLTPEDHTRKTSESSEIPDELRPSTKKKGER